MPRTHGRLKLEVWDVGSEFRGLSIEAQWAYAMLVSQPGMTMCGTLVFAPKKWAKLARSLSLERLEAAIAELEGSWYVIVDRDTDELLVRTFIKHDEPWRLANLVVAARTQFRSIESSMIRDYLARRHEWLTDAGYLTKDKRDAAKLVPDVEKVKEYEERRASERASERTLAMDIGHGHSNAHSDTRAIADAPARVQPSTATTTATVTAPTTAAEDLELLEPKLTTPRDEDRDPAAGLSADPATLGELSEIVEGLPGADPESLVQVEPLALQLPRAELLEVVDKLRSRQGVKNPVGWLVAELRKAVRRRHSAWVAEQENGAAQFAVGSSIEKLKREKPEDYVRAMAPIVGEPELAEFLRRYVADEDERIRLADLAADVREESAA